MSEHFHIELRSGQDVQLCLAGELDVAATRDLDLVLALVPAGADPVVVDFAEVTFADVAGLRAVGRARRRLEAAGHPVQVVHLPRQVDRVLRVARLAAEVQSGSGGGPG